MIKPSVVTIILTILFYLVFLFFYLQDVINELMFLCILFIGLVILLLTLIVFRKRRASKRKTSIAIIILFLLFSYEFLLLGYTTPSHLANLYVEPTQAIEDSGIYLLAVNKVTLRNKHDNEEILATQNGDVLTITKLNNRMIYGVKNSQLLLWLHLQKEPIEETEDNVKKYLGQEDEWLDEFFSRKQIGGDSSGLSLVLSGLYKRGDLKNQIPIAVTGAINEKGDVLPVGYMKEKIQIAEKSGIPFMIIPSENAVEVAEIQNELKANVEIFDVSNVEEAIQLINDLNEKQ
ncbi:S16 family serine protease [Paenisporosarcina indica]|uniref:S16 family serine protease n=1 Tax=Paenisporosarcina indica TaxID=650093 RepID=UPI00094F7B63|nr:S16 family serine protease [Paenisporosarcina indica]